MTTKNIQDVVAELKRKHPCIVTDKMSVGNQSEIYIDFFDDLEDTLTQHHQDLMSEVEEKERSRLENEFGDFAHEHYRGCVREADSTYTYGYDNEVIWLVREFFEKQALTEAQNIIKSK